MRYVEFASTSNFSFLRGASHPEELMAQAAKLGLAGLGLSDRNSVAGVVRAHVAKRESGLPLRYHPGARLVFADGTPDVLAYPRDRAGWGRLCRLLTLGNRRAAKGDCILHRNDLLAHVEGLELIAMEACTREAFQRVTSPLAEEVDRRSDSEGGREGGKRQMLRLVSTPLSNPPPQGGRERAVQQEKACALRDERHQLLMQLRAAAPGRVRLAASMLYRGDDRARLARLVAQAREAQVPLIAVNDVLYHAPGRRPLQDVLTCIRGHLTLAGAGRRLTVNAERHLKPAAEMVRLFRDCPEAVAETLRLSEQLTFSLDELRYEYPDETREGFATPQQALAHFTYAGAAKRYPDGIPDKVRKNLDYELKLIASLDYAPYFLTVHDIVRYAREQDILCQGRGSAANSAVCFCLGVTEVDPDRIDLLFERFVSAERREPPDIDVDFEHERREEVIQYIYGKYGRERAGLAATVISYRGRSAVREVGKAFALSEDTIGAVTSSIWGGGGGHLRDDDLNRAGLDVHSGAVRKMLAMVGEIVSFPRHLSQHVGGFVITRGRLDEVVPIQNAAMEDRTCVEWDKDDLDALGILKIDVLGLGMLTCLRKALDLVEKHYPSSLPLPLWGRSASEASREGGNQCVFARAATPLPNPPPQGGRKQAAASGEERASSQRLTLVAIPAEDPAVYRMLARADSLGVFQIESRAQMTMLPRLKPENFYDLVVEVAIVRPGPIQGDMVHPYLRRRQGLEPVSYPSEELKAVLGKTLGVPLFQEQAMKIAIVAGGFTPSEADRLRRAMATFRRVGTIGTFQHKMIEGMVANGYERDFAERCFHQIEGFGEYGFPESHAASFALLVYASAWLKCHYPDVFAAALLNAQPMGFYAPAQIVRDVREHGVEVRPPDVNFSAYDATLEPGPAATTRLHELHRGMEGDIHTHCAIRLGLREIKGLSEEDTKVIEQLRGQGYDSLRDLWLRTGLAPRVIERLADADAFGSLGLTRREALWAVKALQRSGDHEDLPLFRAQAASAREPDVALVPMPLGEEVVNDYRFLKLSLRTHPASFLRADLARRHIAPNETLRSARNGARVRVSGLITVRQRPGTAKGVIFMTIEDETAIANIIVWPKLFERFRPAVLGARYVAVSGRMQAESGVIHVVADKIEDLTPLLARLAEGGAEIESLARCDEVRRPVQDDPRDIAARGGRKQFSLIAEMPELAADLDVPARASRHVPAKKRRMG
jgi:DNA-directed DNA polymerase III PolC